MLALLVLLERIWDYFDSRPPLVEMEEEEEDNFFSF